MLKWEYDEYDRITKREFPSGESLTYTYEGNKLKSVTDKQKRRFEFFFNERMELENLTYPGGISRNWKYDPLGRVTESRDVKGNVTRYRYDILNRITRLEEPDGNVHHFQYDASGNLVHATDNLREVEFTYGPLGILTSRKQGLRTVRFDYNSELQLNRIRNEKGDTYDFDLDGLGQVVAEYGFDGIERHYDRDGLGRVRRICRPSDRWTEFLYDGNGNVIQEEQYDGKLTRYAYNNDGQLVKAYNDTCKVEFKRDKAGRIISEKQNEYEITHTYDKFGNHISTGSSLGASIENLHDADGSLIGMSAGKDKGWQSTWERDETGLEILRRINSGLEIRTWRDNFGRETKKHIAPGGGITGGSYSYSWGINNRLLQKTNDLTGLITRFEYNEFDDLDSAMYRQGGEVETIYRVPDRIGALYKEWHRRDTKYGRGGELLEDIDHYYHYDVEGNLIFKEYKQAREEGFILIDKKKRAKELGIEYLGSGTGWQYTWYSNGMLEKVARPDGTEVVFTYDALGRRISKSYCDDVTRWVWDGNTPLHECVTEHRDRRQPLPAIRADDENLITWIFEAGTFVPAAKITKNEQYTIVTDYLGTPIQMYDSHAKKTWDCELDIYGKVRTFEGSSLSDCPFRYQGQYEDEETGLYYNRFRFYDPNVGRYISQDPIGLAGGLSLYGYVCDSNLWIDIFGWHGNSLDNIADSQLYDIKINGTQFKYGIATEKYVTKTDISVVRPNGTTTVIPKGTPTRIKDQLRKAYSNYDDVQIDTKPYPQISTSQMRDIETKKIQGYVDITGKVPSGNADHALRGYGDLSDDFAGVHDLKKDLTMQNNTPKADNLH